MEQETKSIELNYYHETKDQSQPRTEETQSFDICQICGYMSYSHSDSHPDSHPLTHMTPIVPYLYLGSKLNAHNFYEMKYFDIKTVINVADEIPKICADEFKYVKYNWDDIYCFDIL